MNDAALEFFTDIIHPHQRYSAHMDGE